MDSTGTGAAKGTKVGLGRRPGPRQTQISIGICGTSKQREGPASGLINWPMHVNVAPVCVRVFPIVMLPPDQNTSRRKGRTSRALLVGTEFSSHRAPRCERRI
jgi:hypothetical protein